MNAATVLFAWRRTPPPFLIGGAEVSQQLLAEEFAAAGWKVVYLGSHEPPWTPVSGQTSELAMMRHHLTNQNIYWDYSPGQHELRYTWHGIECRAVPQNRLARTFTTQLKSFRPELVITSQEGSADIAEDARRCAPVAGWLHSISKTGLAVLSGRPRWALATSRFVLSRTPVSAQTKAMVFYPPFNSPRTTASTPRTGDLLMVNPIPPKGSELLHRLVHQMPNRRFTLVQGWWDTSAEFAHYPNVTYVSRTYDMGALYARHRLLLVPSLVEDAFPRVIIEAGLAGLPSVGSARGGIPEAIEDGGLLIPSNGTAAWVEAIVVLDDPYAWAKVADRAAIRAAPLTRSCLPELAAAGIIPG